jgi:hypothetical protein
MAISFVAAFMNSSSWQWSVKNTFVHCDSKGEQTNNAAPGAKWKARTDITAARDQSALSYMTGFTRKISRDLSSQMVLANEDEVAPQEQELSSSDLPSPVSRDSRDDDSQEEVLENRITNSIGAANHFEGTCKPCAWNWKPSGCSKGSDCDFCHLCEQDATKQRRRQKIARLRAEEKAARRAKKAALSAEKTGVCPCGNVFLPDSIFCRKCGAKRPSENIQPLNSQP